MRPEAAHKGGAAVKNSMECKEFEKLIPAFIHGRMDYRTLKRFKEHYDACSDCREEMAIQFLVKEGIARLEDGSAFDLQKELDKHLQEAERKINANDSLLNFGAMAEGLAMLLIGIGVMWILLH